MSRWVLSGVATVAAVGLAAGVGGRAGAAIAPGEHTEVLRPGNETVVFFDGPIGKAPQEVRLRVRKGARILRIRLNGRIVDAKVNRSGTTATIRVRDVHGLRRGNNRLEVVTRRNGTTKIQNASFTMARLRERLARLERGAPPRSTRLGVKTARNDVDLRLAVNGRGAQSALVDLGDRRQGALVGASDGLRHGTNTIAIRARSKAVADLDKIAIDVPTNIPIAGAGRDRQIRAGESVRLDGRDSIPAAGRTKSGLGYAWRVVERPKGSRPRLIGASTPRPRLETDVPGEYVVKLAVRHGGARANSQTLAASDDATTTDTVTVDASASALVGIDTMATNSAGTNGIQLDFDMPDLQCDGTETAPPCFIPFTGSAGDLQIAVLDRTSLEVQSNTNVEFEDPASAADASAAQIANEDAALGVGNTLSKLDSSSLVVAVYRSDQVNGSEDSLALSYNFIGGNIAEWPNGPHSIIGIPGSVSGRAWRNFGLTRTVEGVDPQTESETQTDYCAMDTSTPSGGATTDASPPFVSLDDNVASSDDFSTPPTGQIEGYLKPSASVTGGTVDQEKVFIDPLAVEFDTRTDASTDTQNVVALGNQTVEGAYTNDDGSENALQLVTFDPITFEQSGNTLIRNGDWDGLGSALSEIAQNNAGMVLVFLGDTSADDTSDGDFVNVVLPSLERLGVNPDVFARAVQSNTAYSVIASDGQATASSGVMEAGLSSSDQDALQLDDARVTGTLRRGADGRLYPSATDPNGILDGAPLLDIALQDRIAWPCTPADGAEASSVEVALAYLARDALDIDSGDDLWSGSDGDFTVDSEVVRQTILDLRDAYRSGANLSSSSVLSTTDSAASSLSSDADAFPFSSDQLTLAKDQLVAELTDRDNVSVWVDDLVSVFADTQGSQVADIQSTVEAVQTGDLENAADGLQDNTGFANDIFGDVLLGLKDTASVFKLVPEVAPVYLALTFAYAAQQIGTTVAEAQGGSDPDANYILLDSELEQDAVSVSQQAEDAITSQYWSLQLTREMILGDPLKMRVVSDLAQNDWRIDTSEQENTFNAIEVVARQQAYQIFINDLYAAARADDISNASDLLCEVEVDNPGSPGDIPLLDDFYPFSDATGSPQADTGDGNQYWARTSPTDSSAHNSFVMFKRSWASVDQDAVGDITSISGGDQSSDDVVAPSDTLEHLGAQPQIGSVGDDPIGAGFYMPDFWFENFDLSWQADCPSGTDSDDSPMTWTDLGGQYPSGG